MITATTLTATILIIDTATDTVVRSLPCNAGCHGVNFGAKQGGGYYAYVSSKFSNDLIVVDPDPNNDGNPIDAKLATARKLIGQKKIVDAIKTYDDVLKDDPNQPEALTYRGWLLRLTSLQAPNLTALADQGLRSIEQAERANPPFKQARRLPHATKSTSSAFLTPGAVS